MATAKELGLDSLEGFALVESGTIQEGDLRVASWPDEVWWPDDDVIGLAFNAYGYETYRRIHVAAVSAPAKAATHDEGKAPLSRLPWAAIREMGMVQLYGAQKYGTFENFRAGMEVSRNLSCAVRHIAAYMEGEGLDKESGRSHLAHAMCRLAFVLQNEADGVAIDDRYVKPSGK